MTEDFHLNIRHCLRCPLRQFPCAGPCACLDGRDIMEHASADYCPHPKGPRFGTGQTPEKWEERPPPTQTRQISFEQEMARRGPPLWAELHRTALRATHWPEFIAWFRADFLPRVPCGDCRDHATADTEELATGAASEPFPFTVALHNRVNRRLKKPEWTVEGALKVWGT